MLYYIVTLFNFSSQCRFQTKTIAPCVSLCDEDEGEDTTTSLLCMLLKLFKINVNQFLQKPELQLFKKLQYCSNENGELIKF